MDSLLAPASVAGVRMLLRALKLRQVLGILPDQVPAEGDGVWRRFFGRSAYTMVLPSKLACAAGGDAIVLGARCRTLATRARLSDFYRTAVRKADRQRRAKCRRHQPRDRGHGDAFPAQYLWGYNRYKRPAGARQDSPGDAGCAIAPGPVEDETRR